MMERAAISEINKAKRNFKSFNTIDSSMGSLPIRMAMDVNDVKFEYKNLIIDENDIIEK
jgi:hypothetical protein